MAAVTRRFTFGMGDRNPETGSARDQAARLASAIREVLGGDVSQVEVTGAAGSGRSSCFGTWFALDGYLFAGVEKSALGECDWSSGIGRTLTCQRFAPAWWRDLDLPAYVLSVREELELRVPERWLLSEGYITDST